MDASLKEAVLIAAGSRRNAVEAVLREHGLLDEPKPEPAPEPVVEPELDLEDD